MANKFPARLVNEAMGTASQDELIISNKWATVQVTREEDSEGVTTFYLSGDAEGAFTTLDGALTTAFNELAEFQKGRID